MSFPFFTGDPAKRKTSTPVNIPISHKASLETPEGYLADPGLVDAVNVAITLGQPLLLTGEPGTGKTLLASVVAVELGFGEPLKFETKSTSVARDLFYVYDTVGRFHAAQTRQEHADPLDYIVYNALGVAILRANATETVQKWLPPDFAHNGKSRSVVLIDEIDKAPRDFPNDILNEIEHMYFRVPELENARISADQTMHPLVIITSNSEKHLPDAFLRRCIFYHIPFPDQDRLRDIIKMRVGQYVENNEAFLAEALDFFDALRNPAAGLGKPPATAEMLGWLIALKETGKDKPNPMRDNDERLRGSLSVLIKNSNDLEQARHILKQWLSR